MKKFLAFLLSLTMVFAMAAVAFAEGETYLWDNFDDRDPNAKPELAPNGVHLWWDNWANLRAKNEDGALKLDMRPKAYDPEDYDSEDDYYAHAADWMANWGEAVDMWGLDGVSYCKYLTIRIKGAEGGEENKLIMDWHPEDSKFYAARFSDLVLADGTHPVITTEWQDLVIDLEASGFPGMTNALHIRAFAKCVIYLDEITFSEAVAPIDATSSETIQAGLTAPETGKPATCRLRTIWLNWNNSKTLKEGDSFGCLPSFLPLFRTKRLRTTSKTGILFMMRTNFVRFRFTFADMVFCAYCHF